MSYPTYSPPPADHSVKVPHLVFGLLFLGVAGIWALGSSHLIRGEHLTLLGPGVLVAAGVIGLVASLAGARNRGSTHQPAQTDHQSDHQTDEHTQEIR